MPLPTRVTLAPPTRPQGGLLSAARPIGSEWWRGVTFSSSLCIGPQVVGSCTDGAVTKELESLSDVQTFEAFGIVEALRCSTMRSSDMESIAGQSVDATREFAVARELLTGAASGNPNLGDATDLGVAADAVTALGCLEQEAADTIFGRLAFVHVSPLVATALFAAGAVYVSGVRLLTANGNVVVASPGYDGRAPGGAAPGASSHYAYVTGEVYAETGQREAFSATERETNEATSHAEDAGIAVFDPCFVAAIDTGVACAPTS